MLKVALWLAIVLVSAPALGPDQDDAADTSRLIELLSLSDQSTVADIGAGAGELTIRIAPRVGRVYSTDINPQWLSNIRNAVANAGFTNVVVIEGGSSDTRLPDGCYIHASRLPSLR